MAVSPHILKTGLLASAPARLNEECVDQWSRWLIYAPLVLTTLLAKLSVPPYGAQGIGINYPVMAFLFLIGIFSGRITIQAFRLAFFALLFGIFGLVEVFREEAFSLSGILLMTVANILYVFNVRRAAISPSQLLRFVASYLVIFAILGILQFVAQFIIGVKFAFPIESFLPHQFLIGGFNYLNPLYYGASILKANGVFLLEPSFFSQLMAIGLLAELSSRKSVARVLLFCGALIFSYSGTGLIILIVAMPIYLVRERRLDMLAAIVGVGVFAILFATPLRLDIFLSRLAEFTNPSSSAYLRFVGWYFLAKDALSVDVIHSLFGYGAGTFREVAFEYGSSVSEIFHVKVLIEYGLVGFAMYMAFLLYCVSSSPMPIAIKVGAIVMVFMSGAFSEPVAGVLLTVLFLNTAAKPEIPKEISYP